MTQEQYFDSGHPEGKPFRVKGEGAKWLVEYFLFEKEAFYHQRKLRIEGGAFLEKFFENLDPEKIEKEIDDEMWEIIENRIHILQEKLKKKNRKPFQEAKHLDKKLKRSRM